MLTNNKKRKMRKRSAYVLMLIYFCVFTLVIAFGFSFFMYGSKVLHNNIQQSNQIIAQQYAENVDTQMQRLSLMSYELRNDINIWTIAHTEVINNTALMSVYKHHESSANLLYKYELISDYLIYFHKSEFVLTSTGGYDARWYYNQLVKNKDATYEEWQSFLLGHDLKMRYYYTNSNNLVPNNAANPYLLSVRSLGFRQTEAVIVVAVPTSRLAQACFVPNVKTEGVVSLFIGGTSVVSTTDSVIQINPDTGAFYTDNMDMQYSTAAVNSIEDGQIVYVLPYNSLIDRVWRSYELIRLVLMILLIMGVLVTFVFAYIVAKPIDRIYLLLMNLRKQGNGQFESENITSLEITFNQMLQKQQETEYALYKATYSAGQSFLYNLFSDATELDEVHMAKLAAHGYHLPYEHVIVLLCYIRKAVTDIQQIFQQLVDYLLPEAEIASKKYIIEIDERTCAMIINANLLITSKDKQTVIREFDKYLLNLDNDTIHIAIGSQTPVRSLGQSFQTAKAALEYRFLYPDVHVFTQNIVVNSSDTYYYPAEIEHKIANSVMKHDSEVLEKLIYDLFRVNFTEKQLDVQTAYLFLYALINTVYRLGSKRWEKESDSPLADPLKLISSFKDVNDSRDHIVYMYNLLINTTISSENSKDKMTEWRTNKIINYIHEHYLDFNLSLTQVADHFQVTPQYLSSIFKSSLDENFSTYVQKMRLEKAKELMNKSQLTLNMIAEQSGFSNYLSLSRAFQKYMGISPGAYRQIQHIE
jgi:YesN/AraC family two-component response regulator/flagellar basal body-associated protein FliL